MRVIDWRRQAAPGFADGSSGRGDGRATAGAPAARGWDELVARRGLGSEVQVCA
jgi:hypothetical protein